MAWFTLRSGTTQTVLWRLMAVQIVLALLVVAAAVGVFASTRATAQRARAHAIPSVQHILAARSALVEADAAAVHTFRVGAVPLTGPGDEYQNQIAVASQSLTQLAEDSTAGAAAGQTIQLVEGLLVAYVGLIEQADTHYSRERNSVLGAADLWYASRLMHAPGTGILAQLDALRAEENAALRADTSRGVGSTLLWAVPCLLLLVLLIGGQVFLGRRFRRTLNLPLLAATLAVLALTAGMWTDLRSRHELDDARAASATLTQHWEARAAATDAVGQSSLKELLAGVCPSRCGPTVDTFTVATPRGDVGDDQALTRDIREVDRHARAAGDTGGTELWVLLVGLLAAVLVPVGFFPRIDEYR